MDDSAATSKPRQSAGRHPGLGEATLLMRRIHASATGRYRELEKRTGVTVAGARLLLHLSRAPDATVGETAAALDVRPSTVSNLVRRMERAGWVQRVRRAADQRTVRLRATEAGLKKLAEIGPDAEYFANLLAELSAEDFAFVSRALTLIAGKLPEQS